MISILPHIRIVVDKRDGTIHRKRVLPDSPIVGFSYGCLTKITHLNFGVHVSMNNYGILLETSSKTELLSLFYQQHQKKKLHWLVVLWLCTLSKYGAALFPFLRVPRL